MYVFLLSDFNHNVVHGVFSTLKKAKDAVCEFQIFWTENFGGAEWTCEDLKDEIFYKCTNKTLVIKKWKMDKYLKKINNEWKFVNDN